MTTNPTDDCQQEFEKWMQERHWAVELIRDKNAWRKEQYKHSHVRALYEGFVAGYQWRDAEVKGAMA